MTAVESATFSKLADHKALSTQLPSFCSTAKILCFPDLSNSLEKHKNVADKNFTNYGTLKVGDEDTFQSYGDGETIPVNTFRRYGRDSVSHDTKFSNYGNDSNVAEQSFNSYAASSTDGVSSFTAYDKRTNDPDLNFNSYSTKSDGQSQTFTAYTERANFGSERFTSYGKDSSNGQSNSFITYSNKSNAIDSSFSGYGQNSNTATSNFTSYGFNGNSPESNFKNYGRSQTFIAYTETANTGGQSFTIYGKDDGKTNDFISYGNDSGVIATSFSGYEQNAVNNFTSYGFGSTIPQNNFTNYGDTGNASVQSFTSYRDESNVGDDSFESYGKNSNAFKADFLNYGQSRNEGTDKFSGYGKKCLFSDIGFKKYGVNNTFKDYGDKKDVKFTTYMTKSSVPKVVNKWVESGKFFREKMLKGGTIMPMPDIKDKMPVRSFLPRSLLSKLPFSTSRLSELNRLFHATRHSSMARMIANALSECERAPSRGETKRCVGSVEDMLDFATAVLGRNVVVRTTHNTKGSKEDIMIGKVKGINGGKLTKSVSCHQTLYPYLLYYCHSVPKVRVYEADILDPKSKVKINHGVAICHVDTSDWSASHGAFAALGFGPGKTEVCHWIFENDMNWAVAD